MIADADNNRVRVVADSTGTFYGVAMTAGDIYTVAGIGTGGSSGDGGPATSAELNYPSRVAVDGSGNLVIADTDNNRVRVVADSTGTFYGVAMTEGDIYTVAGNGTGGYSGDGGPATSAELAGPAGVAVDGSGNLVIADAYNNRIRVVAGNGAVECSAGFYGDHGEAPCTPASPGNFVANPGSTSQTECTWLLQLGRGRRLVHAKLPRQLRRQPGQQFPDRLPLGLLQLGLGRCLVHGSFPGLFRRQPGQQLPDRLPRRLLQLGLGRRLVHRSYPGQFRRQPGQQFPDRLPRRLLQLGRGRRLVHACFPGLLRRHLGQQFPDRLPRRLLQLGLWRRLVHRSFAGQFRRQHGQQLPDRLLRRLLQLDLWRRLVHRSFAGQFRRHHGQQFPDRLPRRLLQLDLWRCLLHRSFAGQFRRHHGQQFPDRLPPRLLQLDLWRRRLHASQPRPFRRQPRAAVPRPPAPPAPTARSRAPSRARKLPRAFRRQPGQQLQSACPAGSYSSVAAPSAPAPGNFVANPGSTSQTECAMGTYSTGGASSCTTCPSGTTSPAGASACTSIAAFVIADTEDAVGTNVTFWSAQWAKANVPSKGPAPSSFKGFANETSSSQPACGGSWTSDPGNSSGPPPGPLPQYLAVLVSSSVTKSGANISGNIVHIVVVKTNPGYSNDPGHTGTGTVVSFIC